MGAISYLAAGYAVFIGVTLAYVISLINRQKQLRQELELLKTIQTDADTQH